MNERYTINIFDFDPTALTPSNFDVSSCFKGKEKTQFAIHFSYPEGFSNKYHLYNRLFNLIEFIYLCK